MVVKSGGEGVLYSGGGGGEEGLHNNVNSHYLTKTWNYTEEHIFSSLISSLDYVI